MRNAAMVAEEALKDAINLINSQSGRIDRLRCALEEISTLDADEDEALARQCKEGGAARWAKDIAVAALLKDKPT
jgi:DNA-directed RNA polymerase sigma subunit (sigma70/sigma32)